MTTAIDVRGLEKSYGDVQAVRGISLHVARGEVFALLGPNGAGKTTTVEILEGHRSRTAGDVDVLGFDPGRGGRTLKRRIGIVLQETGVEPYLTVAEVIDLFRGYFPHPRPRDEIIEVVGLTEKRDARVRTLSGGQQRRLDVAIGLAGDPELLFLDEPTTGFDPAARRNAWKMVENLQALGKTIFLTTHYMDEAQHLADRVAIISEGKIVAEGSPDELSARNSETKVTFRIDSQPLPDRFTADAIRQGDVVQITTNEPTKLLNDLTSWALEEQVDLKELRVARATLEDVYLELTGAGAGSVEE